MIKTGYFPARAEADGGVPYCEQSGACWPGAAAATPLNSSQHWKRAVTERASTAAAGCWFWEVIASERSGFQLINTITGNNSPTKPTAYWRDRKPATANTKYTAA